MTTAILNHTRVDETAGNVPLDPSPTGMDARVMALVKFLTMMLTEFLTTQATYRQSEVQMQNSMRAAAFTTTDALVMLATVSVAVGAAVSAGTAGANAFNAWNHGKGLKGLADAQKMPELHQGTVQYTSENGGKNQLRVEMENRQLELNAANQALVQGGPAGAQPPNLVPDKAAAERELSQAKEAYETDIMTKTKELDVVHIKGNVVEKLTEGFGRCEQTVKGSVESQLSQAQRSQGEGANEAAQTNREMADTTNRQVDALRAIGTALAG